MGAGGFCSLACPLSNDFEGRMIPDDQITDTIPVPLAAAVRVFFPHGGMTVSGLRSEARKGRLKVLKIANKSFVTKNAIDAMLQECVESVPAPAPPAMKAQPPTDEARRPRPPSAAELAMRNLESALQGKPAPGSEPKKSAKIRRFPVAPKSS